jgi:cell wall-associated NlpC family hydrolase
VALHCDCSSLVQQAFAHGAGITLPRTAEQQWEYGEAGHAQVIGIAEARPGDVVYFPSYLGPDIEGHTGIITDPATMTMINAPETGKPVGFASYNPAGLPFGTHMFTILRFISITGSKL